MSNDIAVIESDSVIASMTRASMALAEAVTVSQTKQIIDVARAAEVYAKRQHLSDDAIGQATSVKIEATRKLGEILRDAPKNMGAKGSAVPNWNRANSDDAPTLHDLGLTKKESSLAQKLASLSEEAFQQVRDGSVTITKAIAATKQKTEGAVVDESANPKKNTNSERVSVKPDESRLYEDGSSLSAMVLCHRAKQAITQINRNDPKALAAIESIRAALDRHLELITK